MIRYSKIFILFYLISIQTIVYAQTPSQVEIADSISRPDIETTALGNKEAIEQNNDTIVSFNALTYSLQKRYRPEGERFQNRRFTDNMYITLFGGIEKLSNRGLYNFEAGPSFGASVGKFFNPHNTIRGTFIGGYFDRPYGKSSLTQVGIQIDHLFNLSSYIAGFNPKRVFEVSTVEGLGYHLSFMDKQTRNAGELHLGLQLKIHPSSRMDIILEPRATFYTDKIDHSLGNNWHKYDLGYGALLGINYRFTPSGFNNDSKFIFANNSFAENTFLNVSTGIQIPGSYENIKDIGLAKTIGPHINLSIGKWFMPLFGLRLSCYSSFDKWKSKNRKGEYYLTAYGGGRLEALINILSFFNTNDQESKFGLTAMIGAEIGKMYKETEPPLRKIRRSYAGITGGIQAKYNINNNLAVFIEPRFSQIPYSLNVQKENSVIIDEYNYKDCVYNVNIGIELHRRSNSKEITSNANRFNPKFIVSANGGFNLPVMLNDYTKNMNYQFGVSAERSLIPSSSARFGINYARHSSNNGKKERQTTSLAFDYMYNLTDFFLGNNPRRDFNAAIVIGPIVTFEHKAFKVHPGGELGANFSYKIGKDFSIFIEPMMRIYSYHFIPEAAIRDKATFLPSLSVGVSYQLPW